MGRWRYTRGSRQEAATIPSLAGFARLPWRDSQSRDRVPSRFVYLSQCRQDIFRPSSHIDTATLPAFKAVAGLHAIEIAVDIEFQKNRRMIRRPASRRHLNSIEPKDPRARLVRLLAASAHRGSDTPLCGCQLCAAARLAHQEIGDSTHCMKKPPNVLGALAHQSAVICSPIFWPTERLT
jgi:hypothetical protein